MSLLPMNTGVGYVWNEQPNSMGGGLLGNPYLQMGLGILSNNTGNYGALGPAIGRGMSQGLQQVQLSQAMAMRNKLYEAQLAEQQRQADEAARKQKEQDAYSQVFANAYHPAGVAPNMSFMDANNQVMNQPQQDPTAIANPLEIPQAPQSDYQMVPTPASFDQSAFNQGIFTNPDISGTTKFSYLQQMNKQDEPIKVGKDDRLLKKNPDGTYQTVLDAQPDPSKIPSAIQEYQFAKEQGYPGSYLDFQLAQRRAGASRTNVNVSTDKKYGEIFGTKMAEQDAALIDAAKSAPDRISSARRVKEILDQNPITGTGAEARLAVNKALSTAGIIDGSQVKNTEDLASELASTTLDAIKTSGLGSGQGFTDKDRQFLERARSGNIEVNPQTLRRLADLNEQAAMRTIERGNAVIDKLKSDPSLGDVAGRLDPVPVPAQKSSVHSVPLPKNANKMTLRKGTVYSTPKGPLRWNGQAFEDL